MRLVRYTYPSARSFAPALSGFPRSNWTGLESEINRLFETALGDLVSPNAAPDQFPVDLYEDKENVYVRAELPGVDRNDINVEMVEDNLTIAATRKTKEGETPNSFSFSRSVTVPETVQSDKVTAAYENGVLTVTLPKKDEVKPRKVTVSVN